MLGLLGALVLMLRLGSERREEQALLNDLRSPDPRVRGRSAFELSQEQHPSATAIVTLAHLLADREDEPRAEAVAALITLGRGDSATSTMVVDAMRSLIVGSHSGRAARVEAAHVLGQVDAKVRPAIDALLIGLASWDPELRSAAAAALGESKVADARVLPSLDLAVDDAFAEVRAAALESLARLRPGDVTAQIAIRAVSDPAPAVRLAAVYALASATRYDRTLASALDVALRDSDPDIRRAAAIALTRLALSDTTTHHRETRARVIRSAAPPQTHASGDSASPATPMLLTRTSSCPCSRSMRSKSASTSDSTVWSTQIAFAVPPVRTMNAASSSIVSGRL
jgi:HEAT repeat protein